MRTVLVVDDEFGVSEVLTEILGGAGYHVLTAIHGRQALERIAETRPDVILLDFMMPVLNGAGTLAALAAGPAHRDIPVILMSSLPEASIAEQASGYVAFLRKPFRVAAVLEAIARALGSTSGEAR